MSTELRESQAELDVIAWRGHQLVRCGFPADLASRVARDRRFDLHALIELTERGCSPELALRILAPLEDTGDAS